MIGRGKKSQPPGANRVQGAHARGISARGLRMRLRSGKVFRKNAGFPWSRAQTLG